MALFRSAVRGLILSQDNDAFRLFLRRVWTDDVAPLLRNRAAQRRTAAGVTGRIAAATGLAVDGLLRLRGRPFTRFMTVVGTSLGAMLPDVFDWQWLRQQADDDARRTMADCVRDRAAALTERDALALFDLAPSATFEQLRGAWRAAAAQFHPDRAADAGTRAEYHVRFVAYQAAYDRLRAAYEAGRLPLR